MPEIPELEAATPLGDFVMTARETALALSVDHHKRKSVVDSPTEIVKTAKVFLEFLEPSVRM